LIKFYLLKDRELELRDDTYVKKVITDIWDNLPLLIIGDVIFMVFCVPWFIFFLAGLNMLSLWCIVLINPAFAGLMYLAGKIAKGKACNIKDLFFGIYRFFRRALIIGLLTVFLLFVTIWTFKLIEANPEQRWLIIPWVFQLSCLIFMGVLHVHIFPIMTLYDADLKTVFISSIALAVKYKLHTIGMVSLIILMALLIRLIWIGLIIVVPGVLAVFMSNLTLLLMRKYQHK